MKKYFVKSRYKTNRDDKKFIYGPFSVYTDLEVLMKDLAIRLQRVDSGDALVIECSEPRKELDDGESDENV